MAEDKHNNPKTIFVSEDIVEEIFQHLPIISLARFKVLSKKWRSMIESTYFSHKRLVRTGLPTPHMKFLVVNQPLSTKFDEEDSNSTTLLFDTFSRDAHNNAKLCPSSSSYYTFSDDPIDKSQNKTIQVLGSCDGLVLIRIYEDFRYIYLFNPTTKEHMTLSPKFSQWPLELSFLAVSPSIRACGNEGELSQSVLDYNMPLQSGELVNTMPLFVGFGKDIVTKSYKVILIYFRFGNCGCFKAKVISLDNGEQRSAGFYSLDCLKFCEEHTSVFANGSLFWLLLNEMNQKHSMLLAIDLHTEKFRWMLLPNFDGCYTKYLTNVENIEMWNLNDRLCLSDVLKYTDLVVWSLQQEYPNEKWEKIYSINFMRISELHDELWMLGLAAAYFRYIGEEQDQVSFARQRMISYSPTLISPSSLITWLNQNC